LGNLPYSVYKHIFPTGFFFGAAGKLLYRLTYIHRSICFLCSAFFTNYRKKTLTISTLENFGTPVWVSRFVFSDVSDKKRDKTGILSIKTGTRSQRADGLMH
jgi:hypothetical protein